jgi:hypothetical protein
MRDHFRYRRFKTFPMTLRTPQCQVFCPLLSSSEHSGIPEDSKSPLFQVLGFTPTLDQVRVATERTPIPFFAFTLGLAFKSFKKFEGVNYCHKFKGGAYRGGNVSMLKISYPLCCGFLHLFLMFVFKIVCSLSGVVKFVRLCAFKLHHKVNTISCDDLL